MLQILYLTNHIHFETIGSGENTAVAVKLKLFQLHDYKKHLWILQMPTLQCLWNT